MGCLDKEPRKLPLVFVRDETKLVRSHDLLYRGPLLTSLNFLRFNSIVHWQYLRIFWLNPCFFKTLQTGTSDCTRCVKLLEPPLPRLLARKGQVCFHVLCGQQAPSRTCALGCILGRAPFGWASARGGTKPSPLFTLAGTLISEGKDLRKHSCLNS